MDSVEQIDIVIDNLRGLVAGTRSDQLSLPTPCAKWTVRDLLNHFAGGGHMFAGAFRGEPVEVGDEMPDLVGDDPVAAFDGAIADFRAAVREPGALERTVVLPFATLPGEAVVQLVTFDLLVHSWDLARATGQVLTPPDDLVATADAIGRGFIQPPLRDGDTFADEVPAPAGATSLEQLVAFTGRQP